MFSGVNKKNFHFNTPYYQQCKFRRKEEKNSWGYVYKKSNKNILK